MAEIAKFGCRLNLLVNLPRARVKADWGAPGHGVLVMTPGGRKMMLPVCCRHICMSICVLCTSQMNVIARPPVSGVAAAYMFSEYIVRVCVGLMGVIVAERGPEWVEWCMRL